MHWTFRITRRLRLFLETLLVLIMLMGAVLGWGFWHLTQGPIDLKPVLPAVTRAFNSWVPGITYAIGDASLEWGGQQSPFMLRVKNVDLISARGRQIGTVGEAVIGLAPSALIVGQFAPTTIDITSPSLTVTRFPDGHIGLRFDRRENDTDKDENSMALGEIVELLKVEHYTFTTFLQRIMISDVTISYRDFLTQQNSIAKDGKLLIERSAGNFLSGQGLLSIPVGDQLKLVTIDLHTDHARDLSIMTIRLPSLTLAELHNLAPQSDSLSHLTGTLDTEINIGFDAGLQTQFVELGGKLDQSSLVFPDMFETPMQIKTGQFSLRYDLDTKDLNLHDTYFVLPDATVGAVAKIHDPLNEQQPITVDVQADLNNMPMDKLALYWPKNLAHSARHWVTTHITAGIADKAILQIKGALPANSMQTKAFDHFALNDLKGTIDFHNLTTDYLPPMIPVNGIDGKAVFDQKEFTISPTSGKLRQTNVRSGTIKIAPLDQHNVDLDLTLAMDGPLQDALILLSDKPLEFTQRVGIDPKNVDGQADTTLHMEFPLQNDLRLDQLTVKAASVLRNLTVRKAYRDAVLQGNEMHLAVDGKGLTLNGAGNLSGAPLQSLSWDEFFGHDTTMRRQFAIKGHVTPNLLHDLHLDAGSMFDGHALVDAKIVEQSNRDVAIDLTADLTPAAILIPDLNVKKPVGQSGALKLQLNAKNGQNVVIPNLDITMRELNARNVALTLSPDGTIQTLNAPNVTAGPTSVSVMAKALPRSKGWDATIKGKTLDLSAVWSGDKDDKKPKIETNRPPIKLAVALDNLVLDPDYPLSDVRGSFFLDNDIVLQADMDAVAGKAPIRLRFGPTKSGNRTLEMHSPNAGDVLRALNITDSVMGGDMTITGGSDAGTPQQIRGQLTVTDFTMVKAPLLARLLNAFSLGGMLDLLNQKGLTFSKLDTAFVHQDGKLIVKDGRMNGASLGLNFSGTIDQKNNVIDLGGTVVPMEGINKLASKIPLLGIILTGLKGEGLVAATYRFTGSAKAPTVSVNPLSVLTPGILRSILFE